MALAMVVYATDYDEMFTSDRGSPPVPMQAVTTPAESRVSINPLRHAYWSKAIQPYIKNHRVYRGPSPQARKRGSSYTLDRGYARDGVAAVPGNDRRHSWTGPSYSSYTSTSPIMTHPCGAISTRR